jgi:hypothetical protein
MLHIIVFIIYLLIHNYTYCFDKLYLTTSSSMPLLIKNNSSNLIDVGYNVDNNFAFEVGINYFKTFDTKKNQYYFEGLDLIDPEQSYLGGPYKYNIIPYKEEANIKSNFTTIILKPIFKFWHTDSSALYFGTIIESDINRSIKIEYEDAKLDTKKYRIEELSRRTSCETNNCDHTPRYGLVFGGIYQFHNRLKLAMELTCNWHDNKTLVKEYDIEIYLGYYKKKPDVEFDPKLPYADLQLLPPRKIEISKLSIYNPKRLDINISLRISYDF